MRTRTKFILNLLAIGVLAGCASATPYQPSIKNKPGYQEVKIENNRYRISFDGNSSTPKETVDLYALYRAAEITLENGADHFVVLDSRDSAGPARSGASTGVSTGLGFGLGGGGFGGLGLGVGSGSSPEYNSTLYIALNSGPAPKDNPKAYNARELKENLEAKIKRPKAKK